MCRRALHTKFDLSFRYVGVYLGKFTSNAFSHPNHLVVHKFFHSLVRWDALLLPFPLRC